MKYATGMDYIRTQSLPHMWCAGCGNGITVKAIACALENLRLDPRKIVMVSGIGCWGKADDYFTCNALHTTHGRALAYASGVKAANPELTVIVLMGDGDGTTIGGNHLLHAARRNIDLTAVLVNNYNYGMTGGQASATTPHDALTSTSVLGNPERSIDVCSLTEVAGANYVARETVAQGMRLSKRIQEAIANKGFSLVEVASPCTTLFGPKNKMKRPVEMLRWLREKGVSSAKFAKLENAAELGYFKVGKFVDRQAPDFNTSYEVMRSRLQQKEEQ
ncbi:MAG: 2-oxoacid:ferredoxin oxidoreductase subunit beta [Desulfobacterales bacterium]|nr:MAG: 2-oxoacid:ferredoxin oxidoreductase subunit beta [Desulfobacterales bacterium]